MSVIINEMEVAVQAAPVPVPAAQREQPGGAAGPTPGELREVIRHLAERLLRVQAD